MKVWSIL